MNTVVSLSYDTASPSRAMGAYSLQLGSAEDAPHELRQTGPVYNGVVTYRGVYVQWREALQAVLDMICAPCVVVEHADPLAGSVVHSVKRAGYTASGSSNRAIARRHATGDWIANA